MKLMKKLLALTLAVLTTLSFSGMLVGCGKIEIDDPNRFTEDVDPNRTQLYVGYYTGGLGMQWLNEVKLEFEKIYPEYQIMIDTGKDEYASSVLQSNIKTNRQDMYLLDNTDYYEFVKDGTIVDITDLVNTPLTEYGEDRSIADKMNESLLAYYTTPDGKFYAVPYYQSYHHLIYDADLFDQYNLWFKDGGGFVSSAADKKSAGQDGEYGTWDDGLPVTYSEFFQMMDRMVSRGITPITWSGQYADAYLTNFIHSLVADYEGENFKTNFNYDGTTVIINNPNFTESPAKTFTLNASDLKEVTLNENNLLEYLPKTAGRYFALKFAKDIASNPMYRTYNYAESHTAVQRSFLMSNMEGVDKPIAMLIEGGWWMNEASSVFTEMAEIDEKYSMENRRFGVMPLPKADDGSSADGHTVAPFSGNTCVMISENSTNKDIAAKFFRFLHTDLAMQICTKYSGVTRPYDYDMSKIIDEVPYYVQTVIASNNDTEFVYKLPTKDEYKQGGGVAGFMLYGSMLYSFVNEATAKNPLIFFCDNASVTAKNYFDGMDEYMVQYLPAGLR